LYDREALRMLLITGLPQNPSVVAEVDTSKLPDSVGPMAVSDAPAQYCFSFQKSLNWGSTEV